MALLSFTQLSEDEMKQYDLLKQENQRVFLTPKEKFDKMVLKVTNGSPKQIKRFHFFTIDSGNEMVLFDGLGRVIGNFENSVKGERLARLEALQMFLDAPLEKRLGGHKFTSYKNWENESEE